jgi:hypothetical protein
LAPSVGGACGTAVGGACGTDESSRRHTDVIMLPPLQRNDTDSFDRSGEFDVTEAVVLTAVEHWPDAVVGADQRGFGTNACALRYSV